MTVKSKTFNLFYPDVPNESKKLVSKVLDSRWIGQGPMVDQFEKEFQHKFLDSNHPLAVGSGTDALHISYLLAGIKAGDEVLTPVFTCTATNIPLLYIGAKPVFIDVDTDTMNVSVEDIARKITKKTRAIVVVHFGGMPCNMSEIKSIAEEYRIPIIEDAAHALGAKYQGKSIGSISEFTAFSFQAIKHITTGDGGLLAIKDPGIVQLARKLRWFGIDRVSKMKSTWENDIEDIGFKYQMNDISAALGLGYLSVFEKILENRKKLFEYYSTNFQNVEGLVEVGKHKENRDHAAWIYTIRIRNRKAVQEFLKINNIESSQVHYRNDKYSIFKEFKSSVPNMDRIEDEYLVLPLHSKLTKQDVDYISEKVIYAVRKYS